MLENRHRYKSCLRNAEAAGAAFPSSPGCRWFVVCQLAKDGAGNGGKNQSQRKSKGQSPVQVWKQTNGKGNQTITGTGSLDRVFLVWSDCTTQSSVPERVCVPSASNRLWHSDLGIGVWLSTEVILLAEALVVFAASLVTVAGVCVHRCGYGRSRGLLSPWGRSSGADTAGSRAGTCSSVSAPACASRAHWATQDVPATAQWRPLLPAAYGCVGL